MVGYHLWPTRFPGGFIGVDVFFVISGFLITSHLLREIRDHGRLSLAKFYSRRAIRLLPTALIVLLFTAVGIIFLAPNIYWSSWLPQIFSSAFYVENWHLLINSVDYLLAAEAPSPTQHFWTLSVEEQFYILLPLVLMIAILITRLRKAKLKSVTFVLFSLLFTASFLLNIYLTYSNASVAYFNTFARAWEFGIGALLANLNWSAKRFKLGIELSGLALIVFSVLAIAPDQAFPGWLALLPVFGAALVIFANNDRDYLVHRALAPIGDISYSIYLWHWPLIVLVPFAIQSDLDFAGKIAIFAASIALSWLSTNFLENPIRFSEKLANLRKPKNVLWWAAASMATVSIIGFATPAISTADKQTAVEENQKLALKLEDCLGAMSKITPASSCSFDELKTTIFPEATAFSKDDGNRAACWASTNDSDLKVCSLGKTSGYKKHFFAVGDSHLNSLIPALDALAIANEWKIDLAGRKGCHWSSGLILQTDIADQQACQDWNRAVTKAIRSQTNLDGIIVTHWQLARVADASGSPSSQALVKGMVGAWNSRASQSIPIFAIRDVPMSSKKMLECAAKFQLSAQSKCFAKESKVNGDLQTKKAVAQVPNSFLIDLTKYFCENSKCYAVVGNTYVYRDKSGHITKTFAKSLAKAIEIEMVATNAIGKR